MSHDPESTEQPDDTEAHISRWGKPADDVEAHGSRWGKPADDVEAADRVGERRKAGRAQCEPASTYSEIGVGGAGGIRTLDAGFAHILP